VTQVAQLLIPVLTADADGRFGAARARADEALALGVGGFLLYGGDQESVRALAKELQQRSRTPLLIGADLERGAGQQFAGATGLPPLAAVAWLGDVEALRRAARLTAREARTMGVNWNLSPVCDLDLGAPSPVLGTRALGSDPPRSRGSPAPGSRRARPRACSRAPSTSRGSGGPPATRGRGRARCRRRATCCTPRTSRRSARRSRPTWRA
jgi:hypothetical protein